MLELPAVYDELEPHEKRLVREEYVRRQNGKCHYCGELLTGPPARRVASMRVTRQRFPPTFFKYPVHLHHSHDTGLTIGVVHNHCNAVLWQYHGE